MSLKLRVVIAVEILVADVLFFVGLFYLLAPQEILQVVHQQLGVRFVPSEDLLTEMAELFVRVQGALWFSLALAIFFLSYYGLRQRQRWAANALVLMAISSLAAEGILRLFMPSPLSLPLIDIGLFFLLAGPPLLIYRELYREPLEEREFLLSVNPLPDGDDDYWEDEVDPTPGLTEKGPA